MFQCIILLNSRVTCMLSQTHSGFYRELNRLYTLCLARREGVVQGTISHGVYEGQYAIEHPGCYLFLTVFYLFPCSISLRCAARGTLSWSFYDTVTCAICYVAGDEGRQWSLPTKEDKIVDERKNKISRKMKRISFDVLANMPQILGMHWLLHRLLTLWSPVPPDLTISNSAFCTYGFRMLLSVNSVNQLIVVMETGCVFFDVRTEFLNIM
jgi:hypothetical protein